MTFIPSNTFIDTIKKITDATIEKQKTEQLEEIENIISKYLLSTDGELNKNIEDVTAAVLDDMEISETADDETYKFLFYLIYNIVKKVFDDIANKMPDQNEEAIKAGNFFDLQFFAAPETDLSKQIKDGKFVYIANSKLANILNEPPESHKVEQDEDGNVVHKYKSLLEVNTGSKNGKEMLVNMDLLCNSPVLMSAWLDEFQKAVYDAICTIYEERIDKTTDEVVFTARMVCNIMYPNSNPTKQMIDEVTKALMQMRHIDVAIDATDEFRTRGLLKDGDETIGVKLAPFLSLEVNISHYKGYTVDSFTLTKIPPVYQHDKRIGQVLHIEKDMQIVYKIDQNGKLTNQTEPLKHNRFPIWQYLRRRIKVISYGSISKRILFSTMFKDIFKKDLKGTTRKRCIDFIIICFENFKQRGYLIKDYEIIYSGRSAIAVDIILLEDNKNLKK